MYDSYVVIAITVYYIMIPTSQLGLRRLADPPEGGGDVYIICVLVLSLSLSIYIYIHIERGSAA